MGRMTFTCKTCGEEVTRRRSPQHKPPQFCSQKCHGAARSASKVGPAPNWSFNCEQCGRWCEVYRSPSAPRPRFCSVKCIGLSQMGHCNPSYTGGRHVGANGYVYVLAPGHPQADARGYVLEHRLVMEQTIGRLLTAREVVHHRNSIKTDNRPENLQLCASQAEHLRIHAAERTGRWAS